MIGRILISIDRYKSYSGIKEYHEVLNSDELNKLNNQYELADKIFKEAYQRYVSEYSIASMAASLQLAKFLYSFCQLKESKRIIDIGSGFSSFVFRKYKQVHPQTDVVSIDDDENWLLKTKEFIQKNTILPDNIEILAKLNDQPLRSFDLVFLDLNFVEIRKNYIDASLDLLSHNGFIVFDDVHKLDYFKEVKAKLKSRGYSFYLLKNYTLDEFNRFSLIAFKKN